MRAMPWSATRAKDIILGHLHLEGAALPILHALQAEFGYVPSEAVPMVAEALNVSRAEMHGIVSFYHDFRTQPVQGREVRLCRAEACQARGGDALAHHAEREYRSFATIEPAYCLGLCASGPAAMIDGEPRARLSPAKLDALLGLTP